MARYSKENTREYSSEIAREAYKALATKDAHSMSFYGLEAAAQHADVLAFYAEMSDDYSATRRGLAQIAEYMSEATAELARRRKK